MLNENKRTLILTFYGIDINISLSAKCLYTVRFKTPIRCLAIIREKNTHSD